MGFPVKRNESIGCLVECRAATPIIADYPRIGTHDHPWRQDERHNTGDEFFDDVIDSKKRKFIKLHRPCGLPSEMWPICHMRCYLRDKCWAAMASDMGLCADEYKCSEMP